MTTDEPQLISALRAGDDSAFMQLVDAYHAKMVRLARSFVGDAMVAEEVAQEAWLGVLRGIQRFEGRSSLQTWIFTILTNCARTRARREQRTLPFSDIFAFEEEDEPAVDPGRFQQEGRWRGHWQGGPRRASQRLPPLEKRIHRRLTPSPLCRRIFYMRVHFTLG